MKEPIQFKKSLLVVFIILVYIGLAKFAFSSQAELKDPISSGLVFTFILWSLLTLIIWNWEGFGLFYKLAKPAMKDLKYELYVKEPEKRNIRIFYTVLIILSSLILGYLMLIFKHTPLEWYDVFTYILLSIFSLVVILLILIVLQVIYEERFNIGKWFRVRSKEAIRNFDRWLRKK